jgi:transposase-like protein
MHFSKEEKARRLEDWRRSGKSACAYAKENNLIPQTFSRWIKEETETKPGFVEVPQAILPPVQYVQEILIEKGDMKIHIPLALRRDELRAVMEGLGCAL